MSSVSRRVAIGLGVLAVVGLAALSSPRQVGDGLRTAVESPLFPVILIGLYLIRPVLAWPITILSALVGYRYGLVVGVPMALVGAVLTSLPAYYVGRRYGLDADGVVGRIAAGTNVFFRTVGGIRGVTAARLVPTPAEPVSAAAGAGGVRLRAFVTGTLVGELPWTIAAVWLGATLGRFAIDGIHPDPRLLIGGMLAGLLLITGPILRYTRTKYDRS